MDYNEYEKMQEVLEKIEDYVLAQAAHERFERKNKKSITLEDAEKRVGLR